MAQFVKVLGNVAGGLGAAVCLLTGANRLAGGVWLMDMELSTWFLAGVALMVFACLVKLHQLTTTS